jgi:hypothetical protein
MYVRFFYKALPTQSLKGLQQQEVSAVVTNWQNCIFLY